MSFFNYSQPLLVRKLLTLEVQKQFGIRYINWQIGSVKLHSTFYTCVDQACIFWSLLLLTIFINAQFLPISWSLQATLWTILSCIGTVAMISWANYWVSERKVKWVLYSWVILMLLGVVLTDLSIYCGWVEILSNLCGLWLGLSSIGYICTALGVRSRALIFTGILHLLLIFLLPYIAPWQFLITGAFMAFCLLMLAEFQWDGL
ncbi:hypothetical protein NIES37_09150 [Tolypothrix tenuis PCC 7101]|uniref:Uncharacterized protein n=1 Tax=Tolypothrix tenuis PCC 7101 TaxID=231146 RepID=A0A1Z4MU19_9CYAN|nr:hypothetical protein [Aulosira sp. FACHB-113]BAY96978.1 hypothetical protein NIES37_09150 [Tolypothrix tenuis PCC 7101]BAZ72514.1 hypothetical protein NIES50_10680 [Aulosira laxa NIES-50]